MEIPLPKTFQIKLIYGIKRRAQKGIDLTGANLNVAHAPTHLSGCPVYPLVRRVERWGVWRPNPTEKVPT